MPHARVAHCDERASAAAGREGAEMSKTHRRGLAILLFAGGTSPCRDVMS
jgi:hypothetical protein